MPEHRAPGTYLGFDFGTKYIGIATGQTVSCSARPLTVIATKTGIDWDTIAELIHEWSPRGMVVGLPLTANGNSTPVLRGARHFITELRQRFGLPVHEIDEHLSTFAAGDLLRDGSQRKIGRLDDTAAAVILQTWLHQHNDEH